MILKSHQPLKPVRTIYIRIKVAALALILFSCFQSEEADLIIHNAMINSMDEMNTTYQAVAVKDGRIIDLGPEREIMNRYRAKKTIDARKQFVYPGFYDAHSHFMGYARNLGELSLHGVESENEMVERVAAFGEKSEREWIVGDGWDQNLWDSKSFPTKAKLDELFPDRPVYLTRVDGHAALANGAALKLGGITAGQQIAGGEVLLDDNGEMTGILLDMAMEPMWNVIPDILDDEMVNYLLEAEEHCLNAGLTTVTDAGLPVSAVQFLDSLQKAGVLKINVYAMLQPGEKTIDFMKSGPYKTDRLTVSGVKLYGDGALGSRGAWLKEPYSDAPHSHGLQILDQETYAMYSQACIDYGYQLCTHCIGDSSNSTLLNWYAESLGGMNDLRWRIEHAQIVSPEDRHFFKDYAIIPSVQPCHATSDGPWAKERLGSQRMPSAYAYNSLLEELGVLAIGTDFPVERIYPIENFYAAVFRKHRFGEPIDGFQMEEAISRESSLRGMTIWAALASFEEKDKGSIEIGKVADLIILNRDLLKAPESEILKTKVVHTILHGELVN